MQPSKTEPTPEEVQKEQRKRAIVVAKDKKKTEGWLAAPELSDTQKALVRRTIAKDLTDDEFFIFLYRCRAYWLDPLKGEISVQIRNKDDASKRQMVVVVQRDGYLTIAHRSGQFDGMQSGTRQEGEELIGWAKAWNKSAKHPVEIDVWQSEYDPLWGVANPDWKTKARAGLWATKKKTMLAKVAESQALRKAFNISGVYEQSEVATWDDKDPNQLALENKERIQLALEKRKAEAEGKEFKPKAIKAGSGDE